MDPDFYTSETRWQGQGHFNSGDYRVVMSGPSEGRRNGVAMVCDKRTAAAIMGYDTVSDRILSVRFRGKETNITVIQVYAPTSTAEEETRESFYIELQGKMERVPKGDTLVIMGDFNAKVGITDKKETAIGRYGLGECNEAGRRLIDFCEENELRIMNTCFEKTKRRLYTWTSPDGKYRNQIDYVLIKQRWKSMVRDVQTRPGADCGTDHELLVATLKLKLKRLKRGERLTRYVCKGIIPEYREEIKNRFEALNLEEATKADDIWEEMKKVIHEEATIHVPKRERKKISPWLSTDAIKIAEERRRARAAGNRDQVKVMNGRFQKQARIDKEVYLNERCKEMEEEGKKGRTREMFAEIRKITGKFTPRNGSLKNGRGGIIGDKEEEKNRWREYTEALYTEDGVPEEEDVVSTDYEKEPRVMEAEVEWAITQIKDNKTPGVDEVPIELIKAAGDGMIKEITTLCNLIWETEEWPRDWTSSIFIPIFKKGDARECENYRTIALISHTSKILLKIIHKRMEGTIERELPKNQAGFRKRRGTRDHIANLRWIMERQREFGQEVHLCFIDYSKAFDCVNHALMWKTLREMGIPMHLIILLRNLYANQVAVVRTEHGDTASFQIKKGVRQGCILSPYLFILYAERIMREAGLDEEAEGVRIAGRIVNNLRYADDTTLLAGKK